MAKYKCRKSGSTVELDQSHFKAKGGEGSIYILGDTVYKICEPGKMIPEAKFVELALLDHPKIIKPEDILLQKNQPIGYTMRLVPGDAKPLAQILTKSYREREGVTPDHFMKLVSQIADGIRHIHQHDGYLQVDGNEFNYMVTGDHKDVYFIDVNSFQTPHFPADAIMPSIRDWHVPVDPATNLYVWSKLSDWYSFAIISFYMFTAIHPFKGRHSQFTNMKTLMTDQMKASKSVLDPQVQYPLGAVYHPFEDVIPGGKDGAYMQWYRALFVDNKRMPAPKDFQSTLAFIAKVREIVGSNNFDIREIRNFFDMIVGYYEKKGVEVAVTKNSIFLNNNKIDRPSERFRVGFTQKNNVPFACWLESGTLQIQNLQSKQRIPCVINGNDIMSCEGRVYVQSSDKILEVGFIENGSLIIVTTNTVATIMPNATTMFQGIAVQDMFGSLVFSIFPESGHHKQIKIPELNGRRITDAKYEHNVLMVVAVDNKTGKYSRFVFRFDQAYNTYDVREVDDITPTGINFTVRDNGICVCLTEEEKIEIFSNQKDSASIKSFDDPAIDSDMRLCHASNSVRVAKGNKLFEISVKKVNP